MNAFLSSVFGLILVIGTCGTLQAAPLHIVQLRPGENVVTTGVLDERSDTVYFATTESDFRYSLETASATVLQIRLSDFSLRHRLTLGAGETALQGAVLDARRQLLYVGVYGDPNRDIPGQVIQLGVTPLEKRKTIVLPTGAFGISSGLLSPQGDSGYFGTLFGTVISVNLPELMLVGDTRLEGETNAFQCGLLDPSGAFAYFGTTTGNIMKIRLSDMTPMENITVLRQEPGFRCAFLDRTSGHAYFGTQGSPSKVIRFSLSDFKPEETLRLSKGQDNLVAGFCPRGKGIAYLVTAGSPAQIIRIKLKPFSLASAQPLPVETGEVRCAVFDTRRPAVYLGTNGDPGAIVRVLLEDP